MTRLVWVNFFPILALGLWKNSALWLLGETHISWGNWGQFQPRGPPAKGSGAPMGLQLYGEGGIGK